MQKSIINSKKIKNKIIWIIFLHHACVTEFREYGKIKLLFRITFTACVIRNISNYGDEIEFREYTKSRKWGLRKINILVKLVWKVGWNLTMQYETLTETCM